MNPTRICLFTFILTVALGGSRAIATPLYEVVPLPIPVPHGSATPTAVNDAGEIVLNVESAVYQAYVFNYTTGTQTPVSSLGGSQPVSEAFGINASGQVDGMSQTAPGLNGAGLQDEAFIFKNGVTTGLGTLFPGNGNELGSIAVAINQSGQAVGRSTYNTGNPVAFLYSGGVMYNLGSFVTSIPYSEATAINDSGEVVGWSQTTYDGAAPHVFLYRSGVMHDLGPGMATGINDSGEIIGYTVGGNGGGFLYINGVETSLGYLSLGSEGANQMMPDAINASGQIVGDVNYFGTQHGFLYSGGALYDLNNLLNASGAGWTVLDANAINDNGWIVADGFYSPNDNNSGSAIPILLIPVPEPPSIFLAAAALAAVCGLAVNRRRIRR